MAAVNTIKRPTRFTHEGAPAKVTTPEQQLRRSVMACMLWEDSFYEDGQSIAERITQAVGDVTPEQARDIAIEAREQGKLRHVPLWITLQMLELPTHRPLVRKLLARVIQRPDEMGELLAMYWKDKPEQRKTRKAAKQLLRGLADAFGKFDGYQLAKWKGDDKAITLRDVMFLVHPNPLEARGARYIAETGTFGEMVNPATSIIDVGTYKKLADQTLESPATWEVALSGGADKKETFERLLTENKLGALALLRNLRNMQQAGVDEKMIRDGLSAMKVDRVLPFRFVAAAIHAPQLEPQLEDAMFRAAKELPKLKGRTVFLVDVSYSMDAGQISGRSTMSRMDAACALGMVAREMCEDVRIATFSDSVIWIPPRRGFALRDAIVRSQNHQGTYLGAAISACSNPDGTGGDWTPEDRIIVITDEQSCDRVPDPPQRGYMLNVASYKNGVGYGKWTHVDGFSEATLNYIAAFEGGLDNH